jgi:dipeptidase E
MKLLLTSAGITNASIHAALAGLLPRPLGECNALCISTASYAHPMAGPGRAWKFIAGQEPRTPMVELGWQSVGVLEPTALPSLPRAQWQPWVEQTDVLLVNGGDTLYLAHWLRESGLAGLLATLPELVWVGLSAGSMVMTPRIGEEFVIWQPPGGGDSALGVVDFSIFPHLENPGLPWNTMANAEKWASKIQGPAYAIDDQTAIKVVDGTVEVVSEGRWHRFDGKTAPR